MVENESRMNTRQTCLALAASLSACLLGGCLVKDPLWCDESHPCGDPNRSFCDLSGQYDPNKIKNTCVPDPVTNLSLTIPKDRLFVRRGETISVPVAISRDTGTDGDVAIALDALPVGVTFQPLMIPSGATSGVLLVSATTDGPFVRSAVPVNASAGDAHARDSLDFDVIGHPGEVDTSFGISGQVVVPDTSGSASLITQADSIVIVLAVNELGIGAYATRLTRNGDVDPAFANSGVYFDKYTSIGLTNINVAGGVAQSNGKIVIVGSGDVSTARRPFIVRLTTDGQIDPSLQAQQVGSSSAHDYVNSVAVGPTDEIYIGGATGTSTPDAFVMRLASSNGQIDSTFGAGKVTFGTSGNDGVISLAVQPDANLLVAWTGVASPSIRRYDNTGTKDSSFGGNGDLVPQSSAPPTYLQGIGFATTTGLMAWGEGSGTDLVMTVWRFLNTGAPDSQFGVNGRYESTQSSRAFNLIALLQAPDSSFYGVGFDTDPTFQDLSYHPDILKLNSDGSPDGSFGADGVLRDGSTDLVIHCAAIRFDHRLVMLGLLNHTTSPQTVVRAIFW